MKTLRWILAGVIAGLALTASLPSVRADAPLSEEEAFELGAEAYVYGYPLVTMGMTRRVMTNAAEPKDNHAPMGQFFNARKYAAGQADEGQPPGEGRRPDGQEAGAARHRAGQGLRLREARPGRGPGA